MLRRFPKIRNWEGDLEINVIDENHITAEVLLEHLVVAGNYVGVGQFRVERGGLNGRFIVVSMKEI